MLERSNHLVYTALVLGVVVSFKQFYTSPETNMIEDFSDPNLQIDQFAAEARSLGYRKTLDKYTDVRFRDKLETS